MRTNILTAHSYCVCIYCLMLIFLLLVCLWSLGVNSFVLPFNYQCPHLCDIRLVCRHKIFTCKNVFSYFSFFYVSLKLTFFFESETQELFYHFIYELIYLQEGIGAKTSQQTYFVAYREVKSIAVCCLHTSKRNYQVMSEGQEIEFTIKYALIS